MRYLILSDIHANLEALQAVIHRMDGEYDQVICCGDLVGYGPDPNGVTELVREMKPTVVVRGNHEKAALGLIDLSLFNPMAKRAALWTQEELTDDNRTYLQAIPAGPAFLEDCIVVHGSLLDEDEYLVSLDDALQSLTVTQKTITLFGHTHVQGGFLLFKDGRAGLLNPELSRGANESQLLVDQENKYLINPGSVGQPRDYDPRAAFAAYDSKRGEVHYLRVDYPVQHTQEKMRKVELPQYLIDRLSLGR